MELVMEREAAGAPDRPVAAELDAALREITSLRVAYETLLERTAEAIVERRRIERELSAIYNSQGWRAGRVVVRMMHRPIRLGRRAARLVRRSLRAPIDAARSARRGIGIGRRLAGNWLWPPALFNRLLDGITHFASWRRLHYGRPRTMWGVTPILSFAPMTRCDELLGLRSESLVFTTYYTTSSFDINLKRLCQFIYKYPRLIAPLHKVILRCALIRYDTFNLFCDRGLLLPTRRIEINEREMQAMRWYGRRLYTYTYGADVRTRQATLALGKFNICAECPEPGKFCICDDADGEENIGRIRKWATEMIAMGDMLAYVPNARNFHFWPIDTAKIRYVGTDWAPGRTLRVAHAPNHPHFKGTHYLMEAIERLQAEGQPIELVRVQGVPNSEVLALFGTCDLVVDQFIAGFHGYTMFEAMAVGKPVLCYLRNQLMVTDSDTYPVINTWPDTVYQTLRDCLDGRYDLPAIGRRSRSYIERHHSLEAVALHLGQLYLDTAGFPERVNNRIRERMAALEAGLPAVAAEPPPVSWDSVAAIDQSEAA